VGSAYRAAIASAKGYNDSFAQFQTEYYRQLDNFESGAYTGPGVAGGGSFTMTFTTKTESAYHVDGTWNIYGYIPGTFFPMLYRNPGTVSVKAGSSVTIDVGQFGRDGPQPLLSNSDVYKTITGTSWLWGGSAALNEPYFRLDAASKAAGKFVGKITVGLNVSATAAEGYDLVTNWNQAGQGDVAKFGVDAALTTATTILYFTGVGTPLAVILTGVQIANTFGFFNSIYESFNKPLHGGGGSW
jgi:hypothetical protein